jgi:hypothetical protein
MVLVHANYLQGYYDLLSFHHLVRVLWPVEHLNRHLGGVASTLESFNDGNLKDKNITGPADTLAAVIFVDNFVSQRIVYFAIPL